MRQTAWHGFQAHTLENDAVRMMIIPSLGAKIASLFDKRSAYEWLVSPTRPPRKRAYGDVFIEHDLAGWDEMFPTIDACPHPFDPLTELPDHGEAWLLGWDVLDETPASLTTRLTGQSMAYTLTRTAALISGGIRLSYQLENLSDQLMPWLWAAHPLFRANGQTQLVLPFHIKQVVNAADHPFLGAPETSLEWSSALHKDGSLFYLDRLNLSLGSDYRKLYVPPDVPVDAAHLTHVSAGRRLTITWDAAAAPYLGIWVDQHTYTHEPTIALEPASGYYDSLSSANARGLAPALAPGAQAAWWLEVILT